MAARCGTAAMLSGRLMITDGLSPVTIAVFSFAMDENTKALCLPKNSEMLRMISPEEKAIGDADSVTETDGGSSVRATSIIRDLALTKSCSRSFL